MTRETVLQDQPVGTLLRGEPVTLRAWTEIWSRERVFFCVGIIVLGAGLYGAAMGWWRSPRQGLFVAIKFPMILLLTSAGNALLNAMIAPLLGLNLHWRQSFLAMLMSFAIASAILGAFSPLAAFAVWNATALTGNPNAWATYGPLLLVHVGVIAFAGLAANLRLASLLRNLSGDTRVARRVLLGWLSGNLLLGSQLSWICRPFIGSPGLPVEFLRPNALQGNFYEAVFGSLARLFAPN